MTEMDKIVISVSELSDAVPSKIYIERMLIFIRFDIIFFLFMNSGITMQCGIRVAHRSDLCEICQFSKCIS